MDHTWNGQRAMAIAPYSSPPSKEVIQDYLLHCVRFPPKDKIHSFYIGLLLLFLHVVLGSRSSCSRFSMSRNGSIIVHLLVRACSGHIESRYDCIWKKTWWFSPYRAISVIQRYSWIYCLMCDDPVACLLMNDGSVSVECVVSNILLTRYKKVYIMEVPICWTLHFFFTAMSEGIH